MQGIFAEFEKVTGKAAVQLRNIVGWKEKIVEWIREEKVDGKKIMETPDRELTVEMRKKLVDDPKSAAFKRLNGPSKKLLRICKSLPVHEILKKNKNSNVPTVPFLGKRPVPSEVCCCFARLHENSLASDLVTNLLRFNKIVTIFTAKCNRL